MAALLMPSPAGAAPPPEHAARAPRARASTSCRIIRVIVGSRTVGGGWCERSVEVGVDSWWRLVVRCTAALGLFVTGPGARSLEPVLSAQEKTVAQGVYTAAQAARGAKNFDT